VKRLLIVLENTVMPVSHSQLRPNSVASDFVGPESKFAVTPISCRPSRLTLLKMNLMIHRTLRSKSCPHNT